MMRTLLLTAMALTIVCLFPNNAFANHPAYVARYIDDYAFIAIQEMHRSGIPASVTLAQGIQESSWGRGTLAVNSNNHFGIKCKKTWTGPTYYIKDDDYQNGVLIKSCFRAYGTVKESYIDHTNFLLDNPRYQSLFTYSKTDYVSWSKGLKACGYATDPAYATKLIKTIEKYGLNQYDYVEPPQPQILAAPAFHVPSEAVPTTPAVGEEEVTVASVSYTEQPAATSNTMEPVVPAAFNIEDYLRADNLTTAPTGSQQTQAAEPTIPQPEASNELMPIAQEFRIDDFSQDEEALPSMAEEELLLPPAYHVAQEEPMPAAAIPTERKEEIRREDIVPLVTSDTNLRLIKGKTRVSSAVRK